MNLEEAAIFAQRRWRGYIARRSNLNMASQVHLGYELRVLQVRSKRRNLVKGFIQHMIYMVLLISVFMMQHGRTVHTRFVLVATLKDYVRHLVSPKGVTFDNINSLEHIVSRTAASLQTA